MRYASKAGFAGLFYGWQAAGLRVIILRMKYLACYAAALLLVLDSACLAAAPGVVPAPGEPAEFAGTLEAHNRWRAQVRTPPLGWSAAAARVAQTWADTLAVEGCAIRHSPGAERHRTWGENVFSYSRGGAYKGWRRTPAYVVDRWADERAWFNAQTKTCEAPAGKVCGHYTQVVSTYSTHVGCGRARCAKAEVWVCTYAPPGNYQNAAPY